MVIDRTKYMSGGEVKRLRTVTEAKAIVDLKGGRVGGVISWMLVDLAISTGLRVSEMAALTIQDVDLKRGCLRVQRVKKRAHRQETLAIGKDLVRHLGDYIAWMDRKRALSSWVSEDG
jgi:integrase